MSAIPILSNLAFTLVAVLAHVATVSGSRGDQGSPVHPGKTIKQAYPNQYDFGWQNVHHSSGPAKVTKLEKLFDTNSNAAQCLKDTRGSGEKQLFGGYLVPTESYCACMHSGPNNRDMCRVQAEIIYSAYTISLYADKRKVDDAAKQAKLFFPHGPDTQNLRFPCSTVTWVQETKQLSFTSKCGKATYTGQADWTRNTKAWEKDDSWKPEHSIYYNGEISSAEISATVDFGSKNRAEDAQAVYTKCTAKATTSNHRFVFSAEIDKAKDPDQKENNKSAALREVTDALRKLNEMSGKSEGGFICDILKKTIDKALQQLPKAGVSLLTMDSLTYSNEEMQKLTT